MDGLKILQEIEEADMILVGLGEEFNAVKALKEKNSGYAGGREKLEHSNLLWLLPAYQEMLRGEMGDGVETALRKLAEKLEGKNYFIVSTATNDRIAEFPWREDRLVMPCGGSGMKQCIDACEGSLVSVTEEDRQAMRELFSVLQQDEEADRDSKNSGAENSGTGNIDTENTGAGNIDTENTGTGHTGAGNSGAGNTGAENTGTESGRIHRDMAAGHSLTADGLLGYCACCGKPMVLHNVYCGNYDESGYQAKWDKYRKWLQGTLNRRLLVWELGVGMQFPSVIRWPFEKTAFFNQKAVFYRINENLYQMTEELKEKGVSISENAIDWLCHL